MPPKTKFSKDELIDAAFEIAREKGFAGITARSVAERLGSSVAPLYVNFETINDLTKAVVERAFALSHELMANQTGPDLFENIGKASLAFARDYPVLFRELVMQPNEYMQSYGAVENVMLEAMAGDEAMRDWTREERRRLLLKMRVFQLGLTAMVANGHMPTWIRDDEVEELLMEVGKELFLAHRMKREGNRE